MKQTVVIAAALSLGMLTGCSPQKQDPAAQAPPPVQVENEGGVSLITVDRPERFPLVAATQYESASTLNVTGTVNPDVSRTIPVISLPAGWSRSTRKSAPM
jgi:cobalt-zinc-cadmium efflux system membrane fusion protein